MVSNEFKSCATFKFILVGLCKVYCLWIGYQHSNIHSGFTFVSVVIEIIVVCACHVENKGKPIDKGDIVAGNIFGGIATLSAYLQELKEINAMCYLYLAIEVMLVFRLSCCCSDEPEHHSTQPKLKV